MRRLTLFVAICLTLGACRAALAQESVRTGAEQPDSAQGQEPGATKPPTPSHTGLHALLRNLGEDFTHLPSRDNLYVAAAGGVVALGVHPADRTFNVHLRSHYALVNTLFAPAKYFGDTPEQIAMSLGTYALGRAFDAPKVSHLGMDLVRAQIVTEAIVEPLKLATHRERPDGSNHLSFPSGHAAVTFAGATVIERHLGWKKSAVAYMVASYVSASRLHDDRHYASDVAFGAAIGIIAGRTVTEHGSHNWALIPMAAPGGFAFVVRKAP